MILWICFITLAILWYFRSEKKQHGLKELPGPTGYPIVGNAFQFGKRQHETFGKWADQYGDIFKFTAAGKTNIVVSDPKLAKEMFMNDPNYTGRVTLPGFQLYEGEDLGIINSEGELWEVHRRFLLRQLRDFGFGKAAMQDLIMEELDEVSKRFRAAEGKPISHIKATLTIAVVNSLWSVVTCQRFKHDDPRLMKMNEYLQKVTVDLNENQAFVFLTIAVPWLKHVFPELSGFKPLRRLFDGNKSFFENTVTDHLKDFKEDTVRDFIDVYLAEMKKTADPNSVFYGDRAERQLVATLFDLFLAGSETTSTTLAWAILYITKNPEIQRKIQQEISAVTNDSRNVSVDDRSNMPYALATIDEVLRCSSIVPTGVPHRALADKEFQGYFIPKDTIILTNMHYMHHSKKVWGDPEVFRPERFLSQDGKKYVKNDYLIPFQIGRRQCVGETLARDTVFLYLTNLFQRFSFSFDPNHPNPSVEPLPNMTSKPYSVIIKDRVTN